MKLKGSLFVTSDFSLFKFIEGNRKISLAGAARNELVDSIIELGGLLQPIAVALYNGVYYIIDGQHRFTVCKRHNIPMHYYLWTMPDGSNLTDEWINWMVIKFNGTGKIWSSNVMLNFKSVRSGGKDSIYSRFKEYKQDYKSITLTALSFIVTGSNKKIGDLLKSADFKFQEDFSEELLTIINECTNTILGAKKDNDMPSSGKAYINIALYNLSKLHNIDLEALDLFLLDDENLHTLATDSVSRCELDLLRRYKVE